MPSEGCSCHSEERHRLDEESVSPQNRFLTCAALVDLLLAWHSLQAVSAYVAFVGSSTAPQNEKTTNS